MTDKERAQADEWLRQEYFDEETGDWIRYDFAAAMEAYAALKVAEFKAKMPSEEEIYNKKAEIEKGQDLRNERESFVFAVGFYTATEWFCNRMGGVK